MKLKKIFVTTILINLVSFLIYKTTHSFFEFLMIIMTLSWGFFVFSLISYLVKLLLNRKDKGNINKNHLIDDEMKKINTTETEIQQIEKDKEIHKVKINSNQFFMKFNYTNLLELLITIALSFSLFTIANDGASAFAALLFSIILISITLIEWKRRKTSDPNENFFIKYIYLLFVFFVFIIGVWLINQVNITRS